MSEDNLILMDPDQEKKHKQKLLLKRAVILLITIAAVCSLVALFLFGDGINLDSLRRWVKYMNVRDDGVYGSYSFDSHSSNRYGSVQDGLALASVSGVTLYGESGEEETNVQIQLSLPRLIARGEVAMAYDVGGYGLVAVHSQKGEVLRLAESRPILDADLSDGGHIALVSSASGYKSVISVYNDEQRLVYRWLSSSTYLPLCAVSSDGKWLAAIGLGQSGGAYDSSLHLFRTDSEETQHTVSLGSQIVYDLLFLNNNTICAVSESGLQFVDTNGELLGDCDYRDLYLKDYDDGGDGFLCLSLNMYKAGNRYSLVTVDEKGNQLAEVYIGQEILDLSACGKYVAVLTSEGLTIYNQYLSVYHQTVETGNATSAVMREDGSVLLLGSGSGNLYIP